MSGPILVTGATGGLGRVLVERLQAAGHVVRATGRNAVIGQALAAPFVAADLAEDRLDTLCAGVETVIHLAALSSPWGHRATFERANVVATRRLLNAAAAAGCRRFIYTSTPSIYTRAAHQTGITEATPLPPHLINAYAETKLAAERMVLAERRMESVSLRPRAIISPYDSVLLPRLLSAARRGRFPLPGGGNAALELTDARDVCEALLAAVVRSADIQGRAFNISGGAPRPLHAIAAHAFARLGQIVRLVNVPLPLAQGLARLLEGVAHLTPGHAEPALTRYAVLATGYTQTFDLSAARTALNWVPRYTPEDAIDWALPTGDTAHA